MSEYIKREDAIKEIKEWATNLLDPRYIVREDAECALMDLPSADVVEVNHSVWKVVSADPDKEYECMKCKKAVGWKYLYCPNCGARMDGREHE